MNWTRIGLVAAVLVLGLVAFLAQGRPGEHEMLDEEPEVSVLVDPDAGQVEQMTIEQYVMGVVGGEMGRLPAAGEDEGADWPDQAYGAQAILARTFILAWLEENDWQPIPTAHDQTQAYNPDNITPAIERAVQATRGQVIRHNGELIRTYFHSYAGGETASAAEGLGYQDEEPAYIAPKELPENEFAPDDVKRWSLAMPLGEVQAALAANDVNVGAIQQIRIDELGPSGRILQVTIVGSGGTATLHGNEFRLAIGPERMRSTKVNAEGFGVQGSQFVAEGTGFGHGVGLSQWDAFKMAREGRSPEQIVSFFYQDIRVVPMWE